MIQFQQKVPKWEGRYFGVIPKNPPVDSIKSWIRQELPVSEEYLRKATVISSSDEPNIENFALFQRGRRLASCDVLRDSQKWRTTGRLRVQCHGGVHSRRVSPPDASMNLVFTTQVLGRGL